MSDYPGQIDSFVNPTDSDTLDDPPHDAQHADVNNAIVAVQNELGINPRGSDATVRARLDNIEDYVPWRHIDHGVHTSSGPLDIPIPQGAAEARITLHPEADAISMVAALVNDDTSSGLYEASWHTRRLNDGSTVDTGEITGGGSGGPNLWVVGRCTSLETHHAEIVLRLGDTPMYRATGVRASGGNNNQQVDASGRLSSPRTVQFLRVWPMNGNLDDDNNWERVEWWVDARH